MASTVLDVSVFVLCVAGGVVLLGAAGGPPPAEPEPAADRVAATTAAVDYTVRPRGPNGTARPPVERTAHGTLGGLLARAAVAAATVDGRSLSPAADAFVAAVTGTVRERLPPRTSVVAIYEPYPGSSVRGTVRVGRTPPADAAVRATTLTVPAAATPTAPGATPTAPGAVARAILGSLFPRRPTAAADADRAYLDGRCARLAAALAAAADAADAADTTDTTNTTDTDPDPVGEPGSSGGSPDADGRDRPRPCGDATARRLRATVERELAAEPAVSAADRRVTPRRVRIVVRTW